MYSNYRYAPLEKSVSNLSDRILAILPSNLGQRILAFLPCIKVVIITWFCFLGFWFYGKAHFYRDPESMFFNSKTGYARNYSLVREHEAFGFLKGASARGEGAFGDNEQRALKSVGNSDNPQMCAIISSHGSMRGRMRHPIELTLGSLLTGLTQSERSDLDLRVFIANSDPTVHPFYNSSFVSLVDRISSAKDVANEELLDRLAHLEQQQAIANKSVLDISLALEHCFINSTAPYIAFFEDDIVIAESWFVRARIAVRDANKLAAKHGKQWLDLRLFNPANEIRWTANQTPLQRVFMYAGIIFAVATVSSTVIVFNRTARKSTGFGMQERSAITIALLTVPLFTLLFFKAGKSNVISRPDGISIQPWGCCTQGIILPRHEVPGLVSAIRNEQEISAFDIDVWNYATKRELLRIALDPPMVQHLGFNSLVNKRRISRIFPWSVAFEDLSKAKLEEDHQRLMHELYD